MIKSIEIKNFKSIKSKYFPLRNLTLLLGMNGMGKSSFIQSLLMLRQTGERLFRNMLLLNGTLVKIGSTKDALYQYANRESLSMDVKFEDSTQLAFKGIYKIEADIFEISLDNKSEFSLTENKQTLFDQSLFSDKFQYLNANRVPPTSINPKNFFTVVNERNLGNSGEYTAHFIEVFHNDDVIFENLLHKGSKTKDSVTGDEIVNKTLINQINLWMGEISPEINIRTTSISTEFVMLEYVFKQPHFSNTNRFKPENVGFGISYSLPVVTALLAAQPGELIIIENPESHVHPRGQAELGRLIALTAMNGVQVIVETHSDHVLNGIRVAVKQGDIDKEKVNLLYFEKKIEAREQYSKITNVEIDKNGELSEYPKNMLDEWGNQLFKLM